MAAVDLVKPVQAVLVMVQAAALVAAVEQVKLIHQHHLVEQQL